MKPMRGTIKVEGGKPISLRFVGAFPHAQPGEFAEEYESKDALVWASWVSIKLDLEYIIEACKLYMGGREDDTSVLRRCIWSSALVAYGRCFNRSEGRMAGIDASHTLKFDSDLLATHNYFIEMRNKFIAHAGNSSHHNVRVIALKAQPPSKKIRDVSIVILDTLNPSNEDIGKLRNLAQVNMDWVAKKEIEAKMSAIEKTKEANKKLN